MHDACMAACIKKDLPFQKAREVEIPVTGVATGISASNEEVKMKRERDIRSTRLLECKEWGDFHV
jgi:hypothetical protein